MDILVKGLQGLAGVLDQATSGIKGGRTILLVLIASVGHVLFFLAGKETAQQCSINVVGTVSVIFAAIHQPPPTPPSA